MINPVAFSIQRRLCGLNKNYLAVFTGETGSGKSWSAMTWAKTIDPQFPDDASFVCFSIGELLELINSGKLVKGRIAILEEAGANFSNRRWMTEQSKQFSALLQVIRSSNFGIIFTLPSMQFMDITMRRLCHAICEMVAIDFKRGEAIGKYKNTRWNDGVGKIYAQYPRVVSPEGKHIKITRIRFSKPQPKLIESYERKKTAFVKKIAREAQDIIQNGAEKPRHMNKRKLIERALMQGKEVPEIVSKYGMTKQYAYDVKRQFESK